MLDECYTYSDAINTKGGLLPTEPMIMALLLIQHKMIKNLLTIVESRRLDWKASEVQHLMKEKEEKEKEETNESK
jgi:hypothetical protein